MITEFARRKETSEVGKLIKDNREKAAPKTKIDKDLIQKHIMFYHLQISHCKSQNALNKRCFEPPLIITAMREDERSSTEISVT